MTELLRHYSSHPLAPPRDFHASQKPGDKPKGLWVSVDSCQQNWKDFCESEEFRLDTFACVHEIKLRKEANILRLGSFHEIQEFTWKFACEEPEKIEHWLRSYSINWPKVAAEFDGIIIAPYQWDARWHDNTRWYYGWDCASGCIWAASAISEIKLLEKEEHAA